MASYAERKGLPSAYVGLQLPLGPGWQEYCREEMRVAMSAGGSLGGGGGEEGDEWQQCDMSAEAVTQVLEERQVCARAWPRRMRMASPNLTVLWWRAIYTFPAP